MRADAQLEKQRTAGPQGVQAGPVDVVQVARIAAAPAPFGQRVDDAVEQAAQHGCKGPASGMNKAVDLPLTALDDEDFNTSPNPTFDAVLSTRLSRRSLLRGGFGTAATMALGGLGLSACGGDDDDPASPAAPVHESAA